MQPAAVLTLQLTSAEWGVRLGNSPERWVCSSYLWVAPVCDAALVNASHKIGRQAQRPILDACCNMQRM